MMYDMDGTISHPTHKIYNDSFCNLLGNHFKTYNLNVLGMKTCDFAIDEYDRIAERSKTKKN